MKVSRLNTCDVNNYYNCETEQVAWKASAICVGKKVSAFDLEDQSKQENMLSAINSGHLSVIEHINFTWLIEDVSRACTHQLVRHRLASYSQQSQRYARLNDEKEWYVTPPSIKKDPYYSEYYSFIMADIKEDYNKLVDEFNIKPEDARFILPNATKTSIIVTMNARAFVEACSKRLCKRSQWEIREVFEAMRETIKDNYPNIYSLCSPNCKKKIGCQEVKPCGNQ